jgi:ATP-dependent protease ClpP protease subunit
MSRVFRRSPWAFPLPASDALDAGRTMNRARSAAALCGGLLLAVSCGVSAIASDSPPRASAASTSRWWKLDCGEARPPSERSPSACVFTVKLRGAIDRSRLQLLRHAVVRRDAARRALRRDIELRIDADTPGGEVFAAMEIGRMLREQRASITVRDGASCISSCVLLLMGAVERRIGDGGRVGIHRPSLGASARGGPKQGGEDAIVDAMTAQLVLYAQTMGVPRAIVDAMMAIPPDRLRLLSVAELTAYGISAAGVQ